MLAVVEAVVVEELVVVVAVVVVAREVVSAVVEVLLEVVVPVAVEVPVLVVAAFVPLLQEDVLPNTARRFLMISGLTASVGRAHFAMTGSANGVRQHSVWWVKGCSGCDSRPRRFSQE